MRYLFSLLIFVFLSSAASSQTAPLTAKEGLPTVEQQAKTLFGNDVEFLFVATVNGSVQGTEYSFEFDAETGKATGWLCLVRESGGDELYGYVVTKIEKIVTTYVAVPIPASSIVNQIPIPIELTSALTDSWPDSDVMAAALTESQGYKDKKSENPEYELRLLAVFRNEKNPLFDKNEDIWFVTHREPLTSDFFACTVNSSEEVECFDEINSVESENRRNSAYPNPTNGLIRVAFDGSETPTIKIFDIYGNEVKAAVATISGTEMEIDLSGTAVGSYSIVLIYSNETEIIPAIVIR